MNHITIKNLDIITVVVNLCVLPVSVAGSVGVSAVCGLPAGDRCVAGLRFRLWESCGGLNIEAFENLALIGQWQKSIHNLLCENTLKYRLEKNPLHSDTIFAYDFLVIPKIQLFIQLTLNVMHTHLFVVVGWLCSIVVAPREAARKPLAGLCKRREGGGSEGEGRQQIWVMFSEGGDQWLIWWFSIRGWDWDAGYSPYYLCGECSLSRLTALWLIKINHFSQCSD